MQINIFALITLLPLLAASSPLDPSAVAVKPTFHVRTEQVGSGLVKRYEHCSKDVLGAGPFCGTHSCEKELGVQWKSYGPKDYSWCWTGYKLNCQKCVEVPPNCDLDENGDVSVCRIEQPQTHN